MKHLSVLKNKNIFLFIVLVIMLVATYLFEENRNQKKLLAQDNESKVIDFEKNGNLVKVKGIKLDIELSGKDYVAIPHRLLISDKKIGELFQVFSNLRVIKEIPSTDWNKANLSQFIPDLSLKMEFVFDTNPITLTLGQKQNFDRSFYMLLKDNVKEKLLLVKDTSVDPNAYQTDEEYQKSDFLYKRLQMLFYLTNVFFYETKVLKELNYAENELNFKRIDISTFRNKKFSLNFENSETLPPPPKSVKYHDENWISFLRMLYGLEAKTLYFPYEKKLLSEVLSFFEVEDKAGRKYTLEVYKKYGSLNGYFLKTSLDNRLFELRMEDAKYFFVNVQDFWERRVLIDEKNYDLELHFISSQKHLALKVFDESLFKVESKVSVKNSSVKEVVDLLKMPSDHLSGGVYFPSKFDGLELMRIKIKGSEFRVFFEENDLILADFINKVAYHYYVGEKIPLATKYEDYLN